MRPLVSVIIPSYNSEAYIAETIDSVLMQDYPAIELLIVDDGSTDRTLEVIQSYGQLLRLISQENRGVSAARNRGIQEAKGQFICLLDHDDYWYSDKISRQIGVFEAHPETAIVYSNHTLWHADSAGIFPDPDSFNRISVNDDIDHDFSGWIYHLLLLDCWVLTGTAMIRSEVFRKCGVFDESLPFSEDWDLWIRISRAYPYQKLRNVTTLYRQHLQQDSKKLRSVDYRTVLLINSVNKWGLYSQDKRCLPTSQFYRQLAQHHAAFGLHHLQSGSKKIAMLSFFKAWVACPFKIKSIGYAFAGLLGWKPSFY
ncbi:MAG: glycosyltransferase [Methylococcales bacterium]